MVATQSLELQQLLLLRLLALPGPLLQALRLLLERSELPTLLLHGLLQALLEACSEVLDPLREVLLHLQEPRVRRALRLPRRLEALLGLLQ